MADSAERVAAGPEPGGAAAPKSAAADPLEIPEPLPGRRPESRSRWRRVRGYLADIGRGIWNKGAEDNLFFLAGAIAFNVLVAFIPLLMALIGIAGTVLRGPRVQRRLLQYVDQVMPAPIDEYSTLLRDLLQSLTEGSTGLLSVGTLLFLWIATRLVGTLRAVLSETFDIPETRSIIAGKIFDIKMVFLAGTLLILNIGLTIGLRLGAEFAARTAGINVEEVPLLNQATNWWPQILAFGTIWVMFLLIYRYLPPRRIKLSTAVTAATFTSLLTELLKEGFTTYVEEFAAFGALWGPVATFVILVLWIYYTSVVFILGAEVAQVMTMHRIRKRQRERLA